MKTLGAVWIYGCITAFLGVSVDCDTIAYPGRAALLSYSPARGEFPVASVFGRGFFSYIDESGNSRIVSLEPSPLHGVRINSEGRPIIEVGRSLDLESDACKTENGKVKLDRLKPIKEFDELPFQDTLANKDGKLPELDYSKQDLVDPTNPLTVATTNEIGGQVKQSFVFPSEIPGQVTQGKPGNRFSKAPSSDAPQQQVQSPSEMKPGHILDSITEGPPLVFLNPQPPAVPPLRLTTTRPGEITFIRPLPTQGAYVQAKPELSHSYLPPKPEAKPELSLSYLPPKPFPGPAFLNPKNPFLPQTVNSIQPATSNLINSTPSTTAKPGVPSQKPPSTSPSVILQPSTPGGSPSPAAPHSTSAFPSFAPGNPFLPTPSPPPTISTPPPPPSTSTPSPPPAISTPRPPPKNPFLSPDKNKKPRPAPVKPTPQFNADKMNPFLPSLGLTDLIPTAPPAQSSPHLDSLADNQISHPVQVKDTPEVEQAKHEHFLAHQMALAQFQLAQQQDKTSLKRDETSSISSSPNSSPQLPCDVDTSEVVTSGQSVTVIPEPTEDSSLTTDAVPLLA